MDYEYSRPLKYSIDEMEKLLDKISELENEINDLKENGGAGEAGPIGPQGPAGPKGDKGDPAVNPNFSVGTVETLEGNEQAYVRLTGSYPNLVLNFGIPVGSGSDTPPVAKEYIYWGRLSIAEVGDRVISYNEITEEMIIKGVNMHKEEPTTMDKTSAGLASDTAEGDYVLIAVPVSRGYTVTKDDGIGGKCPFTTDDVNEGIISGANGDIKLNISGIEYALYGEILLAQGERFFYID